MKKNDVLLIVSVAIYSLLFYQQSFGINFLIFSLLLVFMLLLSNKRLIKDTAWYVLAIGSVVSGVCVMLYGTWLAFAANITSLSLLSAISYSKGSSVIMAGIYALYSYVSSIGFMIVDLIERRGKKSKTYDGKFWIKLSMGIGIFAIIVIFFFLYQKSNPLFKDLTEKINLDFISWPWVRFTFLGFLLLYGFFYSRNFPGVHRWDIGIPPRLSVEKFQEKGNRIFGKTVNENAERISGLILIGLLNVLLFIVNILDIIYLWITRQLPAGMTFAEYLHQGTGTLVLSIVFAILIILFYFRGALNFNEQNKSLKWLVYLWLAQNAMVIISTGYRNLLYVNEYSLTYKRLGVYIWLVLTLVGLITTFVKIYGKRSNFYLLKSNGWSVYLVLVLFACFNWDLVVTKFNIQHSRHIDKNYLVDLKSPANLPYLLMFQSDSNTENRSLEEVVYPDSRVYVDRIFINKNYTSTLNKRLYDFLESRSRTGWQSWNYTAHLTEKEIYQLSEKGYISEIYLPSSEISSLEAIKNLKNVKTLILSQNNVTDISCLESYQGLQKLDVSLNEFESLDNIPAFEKLNNLNVFSNHLTRLNGIEKFKQLETLNIGGNKGVIDFTPVSFVKTLKHLDLSGTIFKNLDLIGNLPELKTLVIANMEGTSAFDELPVIKQLEEIDLTGNNLDFDNLILLEKFKNFTQLKKVNLSGNNISSLQVLTNAKYERNGLLYSWNSPTVVSPLFPYLEDLNVSSNQIGNLDALQYYPNLKRLNLSGNQVYSTERLRDLKQLEYLNLKETRVTDVTSLENLPKLFELNLSSNSVSDVSKIGNLKHLTTVNLSYNQIDGIQGLESCVQLKNLNLSNNQIYDINILTQLKKLETLDISENPISDFTPLFSMKHLKELTLSEISLDTYNALKENLPNTTINARYIRKK